MSKQNKIVGAFCLAAAMAFAALPATSALACQKVKCVGLKTCKNGVCKSKGVVKMSAKKCKKKGGTVQSTTSSKKSASTSSKTQENQASNEMESTNNS